MSPSESLAPRTRESLQTIQDFLGTLVARYRGDDVLTSVRQTPAREAKFRPMPVWVTSALAEAYRTKAIEQLYSHQASTVERVHDGKSAVVVTPTASGKTLCYNHTRQSRSSHRCRSWMRPPVKAQTQSRTQLTRPPPNSFEKRRPNHRPSMVLPSLDNSRQATPRLGSKG